MSRAERKTYQLKKGTRQEYWSAWVQIPVAQEMINAAPHMKRVASIFANSIFEAHLYNCASPVGGIVQLVVSRRDGSGVASWAELQRVKNDLFGDEWAAIELYPPNISEIDSKSRYLWVMPAGWESPCGLHLPTAWGGGSV